ncbi:remorin 4.1-like [Lolium rigidum]|uniref:remorin 4.1-like n=1 Tax=Lolium rigidum TaxID=89674 RepID=UPI001F5E2B0B|nr:remorin 4.1-like [Lolium rigidum]
MLHERHAPPTASDDEEEVDDAPRADHDVAGDVQFPTPSTTFHDVVDQEQEDVTEVREIQPLTVPPPFTPPTRAGSGVSTAWDTASTSHRSLTSEEQFMTMSREFTAMVAAGAGTGADTPNNNNPPGADQLTSIGEDELEEHNPLAIVPDSGRPFATPGGSRGGSGSGSRARLDLEVVPAAGPPVEAKQVKKEEVETKVSAWQTAEVAQINNRFKREEVVINGWETEQVDKACAWLKKIERKLDEQRAKAVEKTQNDVAKARRKAEDKRASAEAKRGLKLAKVLELANFMKAVGRVPTKRSFF